MTEIEDGTEDEYDLETFKTVLIGDSSVGKTSIISTFTKGFFNENEPSTSSANYTSKSIYYDPYEKGCTFQIWDTCGQEKYRSLNHIFYKDASIAILVYDITQKKSYDSIIEYWYDEVKQKAPENILIVICANKNDLVEEEIDPITTEKWADEHKVPFFQTSAKNLTGIKEMFIDLGQAKLNMMFDFSEINRRLEMEMENEEDKDNNNENHNENESQQKTNTYCKEDIINKDHDSIKNDVLKEENVSENNKQKTKKLNKEINNNKETLNTNSNSTIKNHKKKKKLHNTKLHNTHPNKKGIKLGEDELPEKDGNYSKSKCC